MGFSSGADELYLYLKNHIGPFHWTPAEAFALTELGADTTPATEPRRDRASSPCQLGPLPRPKSTKAANRRETYYPSEPWARARIFGQAGNRALHIALVDGARPPRAIRRSRPGFLPRWARANRQLMVSASTWSERHVAYISGLGTFGLSGGLITERGQAIRLGSVIVRATIPPTPRPYSDPFAYCLFLRPGDVWSLRPTAARWAR